MRKHLRGQALRKRSWGLHDGNFMQFSLLSIFIVSIFCIKIFQLVEMLKEAGAPDGVVNVIHGAHDAVNFICDHPDIRAISFVGSDQAVSQIYV